MAGTPVAPALPTMAVAFEGQPSVDLLVRLMLTMPGLFIALLAPASGWLVDRFGRKPLLVWGTVLYAAAGSTGLYLDSLWAILVGRALLGVAVSAIMTAAVTLIGDYFTDTARHRFLGSQAAFMSAGGMVFLLAGGMLADVSWR
ncbi:MAG: MFS transporter, partial [Phycisphaeraceae bacterium]